MDAAEPSVWKYVWLYNLSYKYFLTDEDSLDGYREGTVHLKYPHKTRECHVGTVQNLCFSAEAWKLDSLEHHKWHWNLDLDHWTEPYCLHSSEYLDIP